MRGGPLQTLTDKKAWTMSALTELRGLSLITTKICSSFSRPMKFPNHDFFASLAKDNNANQHVHSASKLSRDRVCGLPLGLRVCGGCDLLGARFRRQTGHVF